MRYNFQIQLRMQILRVHSLLYKALFKLEMVPIETLVVLWTTGQSRFHLSDRFCGLFVK